MSKIEKYLKTLEMGVSREYSISELFINGTESFTNGTELFINSSFFKNGTEIVYGPRKA